MRQHAAAADCVILLEKYRTVLFLEIVYFF